MSRQRLALSALILSAASAAVLFGSGTGLAESQAMDRAEVERIVREYLVANPEVIEEALIALEAKRSQESQATSRSAIKENGDLLFRSASSPVAGNPQGDMTLVEFIDYQCGYCKRAFPELVAALEKDGKVRLVSKQIPILGDASVTAAKAALAAEKQDRFMPLHTALMEHRGPLDDATVFKLAGSVGLDVDRLKTDMEAAAIQAEIDQSIDLARRLGVRGTPAFVTTDGVVPGAISREEFQEVFDETRKAKGGEGSGE